MQTHIRIEDSHQRYGGEIVPLGDHLRAHKNVRPVLAEFL